MTNDNAREPSWLTMVKEDHQRGLHFPWQSMALLQAVEVYRQELANCGSEAALRALEWSPRILEAKR